MRQQAYVISVGDGLLIERMQVAKELWDAGIKVRLCALVNGLCAERRIRRLSSCTKRRPKLQKQFEVVDKEQVPFAVIIGPDELKEGFIRVKEQKGKDASGNSDGEKVKRNELVSWLKQRLGRV
jgi:histidyl-tRNA synthetase